MKKHDERRLKRPGKKTGGKPGATSGKGRARRTETSRRVRLNQYEKSAREALGGSAQLLQTVAESFPGWAARAADEIVTRLQGGGKIMCCGNGGSAADAQHIAAELSGKFYLNRRALPAISITTNSSSVTAIANDYGYERVFSKQIEGLGRSGDVFLAFSTSGGSRNVLNAVTLARKIGMFVIGFTGAEGTGFARRCDMCLVVPSSDCPRVQEAHIAVGHAICFLVERAIFGGK
ncbi:MAG: D-sedoheptulose 7-phosphate isomerase [Candidatus Eisenbacteria bacterium]|nr:D-sedoheptulose 7-phosphate isomerase [Candidatus Eisenbacteria bacterium]